MIKYFFLIPLLVCFSIFDSFPINANSKNSSINSNKIPDNLPRIVPNDEDEAFFDGQFDDQITVGIIHSLSGTMAISEKTLLDAEILAIEEINEAGGILIDGRRYEIKYAIEDGQSSWPTFAEKAKS